MTTKGLHLTTRTSRICTSSKCPKTFEKKIRKIIVINIITIIILLDIFSSA